MPLSHLLQFYPFSGAAMLLPRRNATWISFFVLLACIVASVPSSYGHGLEHHGGGQSKSSNSMRRSNLLASKGIALLVFFIVPFVGCWLPRVFRINEAYLKLGLVYSAGLFFALAMEHLIYDSATTFTKLTTSDYPYSYMIVILGYMFTWLADIIVHAIWHHAEESRKEAKHWSEEGDAEKQADDADSPSSEDDDHCSVQRNLEIAKNDLNFVDLVLLVFALCFHAFFEGLAVGLQSSVKGVWDTTVTIVIHKFFEGVALGASVKAQNSDMSLCHFFLYSFAFCITAPVGIVAGIILNVTVTYSAIRWTSAIGNAFAAGVFIFVSLTHLLAKGCKPGKHDRWFTPLLKWVSTFLGVVTFSLIQINH